MPCSCCSAARSCCLRRAKQKWIPVALGALAGLMTLARSDGLLWLGLAGLTVMWKSTHKDDGSKKYISKNGLSLIVPAGLLVIVGYLLTMGFWHIRNLNLFGSLLTPGGGRLLWLQNYNQTFIYPPESLTRESFLQAGWNLALQNRAARVLCQFRQCLWRARRNFPFSIYFDRTVAIAP